MSGKNGSDIACTTVEPLITFQCSLGSHLPIGKIIRCIQRQVVTLKLKLYAFGKAKLNLPDFSNNGMAFSVINPVKAAQKLIITFSSCNKTAYQ